MDPVSQYTRRSLAYVTVLPDHTIMFCRAHEQYGYCQAGTSGLLMDDMAVIGSPGPYTWRGTVFVMNVSERYLTRDKTIYHGPLLEHESPVDKYSYLGK